MGLHSCIALSNPGGQISPVEPCKPALSLERYSPCSAIDFDTRISIHDMYLRQTVLRYTDLTLI